MVNAGVRKLEFVILGRIKQTATRWASDHETPPQPSRALSFSFSTLCHPPSKFRPQASSLKIKLPPDVHCSTRVPPDHSNQPIHPFAESPRRVRHMDVRSCARPVTPRGDGKRAGELRNHTTAKKGGWESEGIQYFECSRCVYNACIASL